MMKLPAIRLDADDRELLTTFAVRAAAVVLAVVGSAIVALVAIRIFVLTAGTF